MGGGILCKWVAAVLFRNRVVVEIAPRRAELGQFEITLAERKESLLEKQEVHTVVFSKLQGLEQDLTAAKQKQKDLSQQVKSAKQKLARADKLIVGLEGELSRREQQSKNLSDQLTHLRGDSILTAGYIAYLGPFSDTFRTQALNSWEGILSQQNIVSNGERLSMSEVIVFIKI